MVGTHRLEHPPGASDERTPTANQNVINLRMRSAGWPRPTANSTLPSREARGDCGPPKIMVTRNHDWTILWRQLACERTQLPRRSDGEPRGGVHRYHIQLGGVLGDADLEGGAALHRIERSRCEFQGSAQGDGLSRDDGQANVARPSFVNHGPRFNHRSAEGMKGNVHPKVSSRQRHIARFAVRSIRLLQHHHIEIERGTELAEHSPQAEGRSFFSVRADSSVRVEGENLPCGHWPSLPVAAGFDSNGPRP